MDNRWLSRLEWLDTELLQANDEGKDISSIKKIVKDVQDEKELLKYYIQIQNMKESKDSPYFEPNDFESIVKDVKPYKCNLDKTTLHEKLKGGWYGRIIGCELGKPIEGKSKKGIEELAKSINNYPLNDYFRKDVFVHDKVAKWSEKRIFAPWDDDTNYTILNLDLILTYGRDFTPNDVIDNWLKKLPISTTCTAERVAYKNAVMGLLPPETATMANPFREWIGAAIRGDVFGYLNPNNPLEAAKMAYKDAIVSHIKNGIYGEILVAVLTSLAFSINDKYELVSISLDYIPKTSRLYLAIKEIMELYKNNKSYEDAIKLIHTKYNEKVPHDAVHTISNMLIVIVSLLYSNNDFEKALHCSLFAGFDTDSTSAIVGSIMGICNGFKGIDKKYYDAFDSMIETTISSYGIIKIDNLVELTEENIYENVQI